MERGQQLISSIQDSYYCVTHPVITTESVQVISFGRDFIDADTHVIVLHNILIVARMYFSASLLDLCKRRLKRELQT